MKVLPTLDTDGVSSGGTKRRNKSIDRESTDPTSGGDSGKKKKDKKTKKEKKSKRNSTTSKEHLSSSSSKVKSSSHSSKKRSRRDGDAAVSEKSRGRSSSTGRDSKRRTSHKTAPTQQHDDDDNDDNDNDNDNDDVSTRVKGGHKITVTPLPPTSSLSTSDVRIEVDPVSDASNPIVVSFPSGVPHSALEPTQNPKRTVSFQNDTNTNRNRKPTNEPNSDPPLTFTWSKSHPNRTRGRVLHGHDRTCTYTASNHGKGYDGRLTKLYIALHHRPTDTLRLVPAAERGTVFSLAQTVKSEENGASTGGVANVANLSNADRRRLLYDSFGSTKKRKAMKSQRANVVEMGSVVGAGKGMMDALGKQADGVVSKSNLEVMDEVRNADGGNGTMGPNMTVSFGLLCFALVLSSRAWVLLVSVLCFMLVNTSHHTPIYSIQQQPLPSKDKGRRKGRSRRTSILPPTLRPRSRRTSQGIRLPRTSRR